MSRARTAMSVAGELLITAGVLVLLFAVWQLWWTDVEANRTQSHTLTLLERDFHQRPAAAPTPSTMPSGRAFAIMQIPRLGASWERPVLQGSDDATLQDGLGHYSGTAAPGERGNFAVAGHRTTWGRPLHDIDWLRPGDSVIVRTAAGTSLYAVTSHEIVSPTDVRVIAPEPGRPGTQPTAAWLTLTSCHPKYSAQQRYVVHARLVRTYPGVQGVPPRDVVPKAG